MKLLAAKMGKREAAQVVADRSSLSFSWVYKFMVRQIDNPTINQLDKLIDCLDGVQEPTPHEG